jgi:hypothetical protein
VIHLNKTLGILRLLAGTFLLTTLASAQIPKQRIFSHPLTLASGQFQPRTFSTVSETLYLLAVRVEFKEEIPDDERSSGNGLFDLTAPARTIIDAAPHDKQYFEAHLAFAENYFRKVSNGKLIVKGTVLDSVYRLPDFMGAYSPPRGSSTLSELGNLMRETWRIVDSSSRAWGDTIQFQNYHAFAIFHAGVGRDIDLVSLYGYDPTPFDIPSIYLNLTSLRKMFGESYQGVPVANGTFFITNSMILPETETRKLQSLGGTVTIPLSINGLLAASIGSHLGLPDLFDTKTGNSAIGRFGLMDGQSIFSWNGIFPPEPSVWEKYFLGWIHPLTLTAGDMTYELPAVSLNSEPDSVYRVLISAKEYFLVENRNRDANRDGATVTMLVNGDTVRKTWMRDTVHFDFVNQDSLYGVVIDVDEFDWSLPGGNFSVRGVRDWYDGGILIWHIDENIIEANYSTGTVNANPNRRGVDLEEGDGAQDIGQSYGFLSSAPSGAEDGTPWDFWYANNPVRPFQLANEFTPTSSPNSLSNGGANSHVYIKGFSARGPRMTARIQVGDEVVKSLTGFPKTIGRRVKNSITTFDVRSSSTAGIVIATESKPPRNDNTVDFPAYPNAYSILFGWKFDGTPLLVNGDTTGILSYTARSTEPTQYRGKAAVGDFNRDNIVDLTIGAPDMQSDTIFSLLHLWSLTDLNNNGLADSLFQILLQKSISTSPVISDSFIAIGTTQGIIYLFNYDGSVKDSIFSADSSAIVSLSLYDSQRILAVTANGSVIVPNLLCVQSNTLPLTQYGIQFKPSFAIAGMLSNQIGKKIILVSRDAQLSMIEVCPSITLRPSNGVFFSVGDKILNHPALADIDDDGQRDIIVFSGNKIWAINAAGAVLDNFPITVNTDKTILTSPIVADLDGNGTADIVAVTQEGLVVAYDKTGKMVRGFPLLTGRNRGSTPAAFTFTLSPRGVTGIGLAVASDDGHVYAWQTGTLGPLPTDGIPDWKAPWPQYMHDAQNTGLVEDVLTYQPKSPDFFPSSRAYNWPNPVGVEHNFKTYIRYYVRDNAKVTIKIFDMAGDLVAEFPAPGIGGFDNEVEWDVTNIQSGVYFAHIDAQGTSASGSTVIKIAVIK